MSQITRSQIEEFVVGFFTIKGAYTKYDSASNRSQVVARMLSYGLVPSTTAVKRAILELVGEGVIGRADGKTEIDDQREETQAAEDRDRRAALAQPLTIGDAEYYLSLSPRELAEKYFSDRVFKLRYDAASRLWGFRIPVDPGATGGVVQTLAEIGAEEGPAVPKTAAEYHSIPASVVSRRFIQEPRFRIAIQQLINAGAI